MAKGGFCTPVSISAVETVTAPLVEWAEKTEVSTPDADITFLRIIYLVTCFLLTV